MYQKIAKIVRKIRHIGLGRAIRVVRHRLASKSRGRMVPLEAGTHGSREGVSYSYRSLSWIQGQKYTSLYIQPSLPKYGAGQLDCKHTSLYIGAQINAWHEGYEDAARTHYKDIVIRTGQGPDLAPDIKTPWEYNRFLWAVELAQAYAQTGQEQYKEQYVDFINGWIEANPPFYGINWLCPMEVAIRAINWIISFTILHDQLDGQTRQRFVHSLYDHMIYLEHNWELADGRTSNHYLSDLVGYLYLVWFFNLSQKQKWVVAQLEREMAWQIFDEGTSYEGSTAYHQLVTELFVHADLMARECGLSFSPQFHAKLSLMKEFIADCSYAENQLVKIGDDDSGRVTCIDVLRFALREPQHERGDDTTFQESLGVNGEDDERGTLRPFESLRANGERRIQFLEEFKLNRESLEIFSVRPEALEGHGRNSYPQFGLSIIKTPTWHVTLRHPAYHARQPSGHFHDDAGSITLAYQGIPILVDPGSYVYTPSAWWRNYFRSAAVHNKFYEKSHAQDYRYSDMFTLTLPETQLQGNYFESDGKLILETRYPLDANFKKFAHKLVECDTLTNSIKVSESIAGDLGSNLYANLTFTPQITLERMGDRWIVMHENKPLLIMQSDLDYQPYDAWVVPCYGEKVKTVGLRAVVSSKHHTVGFSVPVSAQSMCPDSCP